MTHIVNGQAGNIESHSTLYATESILNITAVLNTKAYGYTKLTVFNSSMAKFQFVTGDNGAVEDELFSEKKPFLWLQYCRMADPAVDGSRHRSFGSPRVGCQ